MQQIPLSNIDRYGRIILEKKAVAYFRDDEIMLRTYVKKQINNVLQDGNTGKKEGLGSKEIFQPIDQDEIPVGWSHRKENDYFYQPNTHNLINLIRYKLENSFVNWSDSFCIFANTKIKEAKEQDDAFQQIKDLTLADIDKIKALPDLTVKVVPDFAHQKIASRYGFYLNQSGLLEEQGLGKTKTAIETFYAKKDAFLVDKCLVIGPLSVINKKGWGSQIKQFAPELSYTFIRGNKEKKQAILDGDEGFYDFYLVNYEGLLNIETEILSWVDDRTMVICDETTKIKNYHASRAKICHKIGKLTKYKMILNGTPTTQGAFDVFSQMYFLDSGDTFGQSYEHFLKRYFNRQGFKLVPKRHAMEEIHELIMKKCIRFTKKEALPDLPDKTYQTLSVEMTPQQRKYYDIILNEEIIKLSEMERVSAQNVLVVILRLQQITSGWLAPKDDNDVALERKPIDGINPKLKELEDLMTERLEGQPVVIWSRFRYDVQAICKMLDKNNITYTTFIGGMNERQREEAQEKFLSGEVQCFVSIPSAGGFGMNLQRASYCVYYSNDYSLGNRLQSEDRIHRMGQKNNCTIIDICCDNSIDYEVLDILQAKKDVADVVTGDWKKFLLGLNREE